MLLNSVYADGEAMNHDLRLHNGLFRGGISNSVAIAE